MWGGGEKQRKQQQWFMFHELCSVGGRGSIGDFWGLEKGYDTVPLLEPRPHCCWLEQHRDQLLYGQHITTVSLFPLTGIWDSVEADAREQAGHAFPYHYFGGKVRRCEVMWASLRQCEVVRSDTSRSEAVWGGLKQCEVIRSRYGAGGVTLKQSDAMWATCTFICTLRVQFQSD